MPLAAVAAAGVVLGHWLAYRIAVPQGHERASVLAQSGHGYWFLAVKAAVILGLTGAGALFGGHVRAGARGEQSRTGAYSEIVVRLAMLQAVAFTATEMAERQALEQTLRRSEQELADFFDHAPMALHWVGPDGIILRVNEAELRLLGYARDAYLGHHIAEFHADQHVIADILRRLHAGEELQDYEARLVCQDGTIKHVLINANVLWEQGQFIHTRCFTRDITERKRGEETRERLAAIVDSSDDAIIGQTL